MVVVAADTADAAGGDNYVVAVAVVVGVAESDCLLQSYVGTRPTTMMDGRRDGIGWSRFDSYC